MYVVCQVECGAVLRHSLDLSFGGKDKDFGGIEIQFYGVEEVERIGLWVIEYLLDGVQPGLELVITRILAFALVFPVCGNTTFSNLVHLFTTYLHLNPLAALAHEGCVQSLVAVCAGLAYPIAQTVGVRVVELCKGNVYLETFIVLILSFAWCEYDAHGKDVIDVLKGDMLLLHLVPDGVGRFHTSDDVVFEAHGIELCAYGVGKLAV